MGVLTGIRVLDFGRFIAGPFCSALLADFGADVIRIDRVEGGEDRFIMPVTSAGDGALFLQANRNKRSLTLNLESQEGREVVRQLLVNADVVVANMPPRTMQNLGLDYASLCQIKPNIILTASTAFGAEPAVCDRVGFDGIGQAMSGLVHLSGLPEQPVKAMVPVVDFATAMSCALGTVMALYERKSSGKGQEVTASLLRTALNFSSGSLIEESLLQLDRKATLNRAAGYAPSDIFRVKDGWIIVQVIGQAMFKRWARMIGRPELTEDPRFGDDPGRGEHGEFISGLMSAWCSPQAQTQALEQLEKNRIPAGPVHSPRQALNDETVRASNSFEWLPYPGATGPVPVVAPPVSLSRTPPTIRQRAPTIGEHTHEILTELGYASEAIAELKRRGIV